VPDAQQPTQRNSKPDQESHKKWAAKVNEGVSAILTGRRKWEIPVKSQTDLCMCMNLLDAITPLPFSWDIDIYTNPPPLRAPRVPTEKVGSLIGDKPYKEFEDSDGDYDDDDLDPIARPEWNPGEVHILKLPETPFWGMAR